MTTFSSFSHKSTMTTFRFSFIKRCDRKKHQHFLSFCFVFSATILVVITILILISHYLFSFALKTFFCRWKRWGKNKREGDRSGKRGRWKSCAPLSNPEIATVIVLYGECHYFYSFCRKNLFVFLLLSQEMEQKAFRSLKELHNVLLL